MDKISKNILLIAGIRPVKDVIFALDCWKNYSESKNNNFDFKLLIIGPIIDEEYSTKVFKVRFNNEFLIRIINPCTLTVPISTELSKLMSWKC